MKLKTLKLKKKLLSALVIASLSTATIAQEGKHIEVSVESDGVNTTKVVKLNGKVLNDEEISALEVSGELHSDHAGESSIKHKVIHANHGDISELHKDIQIMVNSDEGKMIKKVIMNGKELTQDEIAELEASGELKTLHMDSSDMNGKSFKKIMVFNSDGHDDNKQVFKTVTETIHVDDDSATLGFMTNIKDNGWHVVSVIDGSGAQEAGLKAGDIIKFMGDKDLTVSNGDNLKKQINKTKREVGDMVDLEVDRDGELVYMSVEARKNNSVDMVMDIKLDGDHNNFSWVEDLKGVTSTAGGKNVKVMVMNGDMGSLTNFDNVDVNIPEMLGNMNIFIHDGNSTSKLLGKNHEMSALSEGLESYFDTKGGVLIMHVSPDNVFGLKDGDVVKSIAGVNVETPKDVIKQLLKADKQENLKMKIVRHKRNKTLKYNK